MLDGVQTSVTAVIVGPAEVTLIFADPNMFVYPVTAELALQVAVPAPDGVKSPPLLIVPPVAVHVTSELKAPVPKTVAEHCDVCPVLIDAGDASTVIDVIVNGTLVMLMDDVPEMLVYPACVDVAVQDPVPVPDGVKTPPCVMVPPVAVHVTPELNAPVPLTVATQVEVCEVVMADGLATT
jgi:hypothetical protein